MASVTALLSPRWFLLLALLTLFGATPVRAQDDDEKAVNLSNCLSRKNLSKCKKGWLTPQDLLRVDEIERQENQRICLTGKTPDKCDRALLSLRDIQQTIVAERRENLKNCLLGPGADRRPCRREWLNEAEAKRVEGSGKTPMDARPTSVETRPSEPTPSAVAPAAQPAPAFPARPERLGGALTTPAKPPVLPAPTPAPSPPAAPVVAPPVAAPAPRPLFIEVPQTPEVRKEAAAKAAREDKAAKVAKLRAAKAAAAASASREARAAARSKTAATPAAAAPGSAAAGSAREPESPYAHCNAEQFIENVSSEGRVAELEDGSLWIIALRDADRILSWDLPAHVAACPTELVNVENGQSVQARRQE